MTALLQRKQRAVTKSPKTRFDSSGIRKATIALLGAMHESKRHQTLSEVLLTLEVLDAHMNGRPHTLKSLSKKLDIPYTSVSRIIWGLTSDAAPGGLLKLKTDPQDRRKKRIEVDLKAFQQRAPIHIQAVEQALLEYYGRSVYKLKRKK